MALPLKLDRPLAVFDIESTGISPRADRIIELAIIRIEINGARQTRTWLLNPTVPIPTETTAIHGITNETVENCPTFADEAQAIRTFLADCDLAGFNHTRFDIPMLCEEFNRVGTPFDIDGRRVLDAQRIFHIREPRDLTAALAFYCDETHTDAHGAQADTEATLRVLEGQFARYPDLPRDIDTLDRLLNPRDPFAVDRAGRLRWVDNEITINFGRKKGQKLHELVANDPGFLKWLLRSDFPPDTREIVQQAIDGHWPDPPAVTAVSDPRDDPYAKSS